MTRNLPSRMDLGRFAVVEDGVIRDLTNNDVIKLGDYVIRENLFEETNQNIHDLLHTIAASYKSNFLKVTPIIQKFNIEVKEFERILSENISHLRAIVANPHSLLDKNTTKVNIGRAKRISTRSYQHLAHHSEDWEKMSILSPKPRKILHEELIIDYTVYENLLFKAFILEAIKHLNKRIKETADITKFFLSIFDPIEFENVWADKIDRSNALVGRATKCDRSKDSGTTNRTLSALKSELVKLEHSNLFEEFPRKNIGSIVYHNTNVLNSHKHYKYLKILWLELKKVKEQAGEKDPFVIYQDIMNNMRTYTVTLFVYSLYQMGYSISKDNNKMTANHSTLPMINLNIDKYGVLIISTEHTSTKIVSLGGIYDVDNTRMLPDDTLCFCFCDFQKAKDNSWKIYYVNPIDTNSIECSGHVIRKLIIKEYQGIAKRTNPFKHSLRDFVSVIKAKSILWNTNKFSYSFGDEVPESLDATLILSELKELPQFKQRNKRDQDSLMKDMSELISDIGNQASIVQKTLVCPKCAKIYRSRNISYMTCDCGFICDISRDNARLFQQDKDGSNSNITVKGWGMDFVE